MGPRPWNTRIEVNGVNQAVVYAAGEIDASTLSALQGALAGALEQSSSVVLDMGGVTFMDSSGLGALLGSHRAAQQTGGSFLVRRPSHGVRRVLSMTGLDSVLQIDVDSDHAQASE
jgi:anti-anti-sigma factor